MQSRRDRIALGGHEAVDVFPDDIANAERTDVTLEYGRGYFLRTSNFISPQKRTSNWAPP